MKIIALLLWLLLLALAVPAWAQVSPGRPTSDVCDPALTSSTPIIISSAANNEIVALSGTKIIYVCDVTLISDGTVGVQMIKGTGTACATNEANLSGVFALIANVGFSQSFGGRIATGAGDAFCLELSGAVAVNGVLTYRQL